MHRFPTVVVFVFAATLSFGWVFNVGAAEEPPGWRVLFDGKDLSNWQNADGDAPGAGWVVRDGAMSRQASAGDIWTKDRFDDFILELEFKTTGNSGIFIRTDKPRDCVQTGIEIQVNRPVKKPNKHTCGAMYDLLAPGKEMTKNNDWNHILIAAKDNKIVIVLNDVQIIRADLNNWTEAHKNPDGTKNKFRTPLKDFKREGHIGFQDHGANVSYRNVRIKTFE